MKKYFKDLNKEEIKLVLEKNEQLLDEVRQALYEVNMDCQSEDADLILGKNWHKYVEYRDNYSSFYLTLKDWTQFINNVDQDYLTQDGIELYNYINDKMKVLDDMDWHSDNYYNLELHIEDKCEELLQLIENMLHTYEEYPDFEDCYNYLLDGIYDNNMESCYIDVDKKGNTDYILYEDIAYTKSYE